MDGRTRCRKLGWNVDLRRDLRALRRYDASTTRARPYPHAAVGVNWVHGSLQYFTTFPVLREDQWARFRKGYTPSLASPPHIPLLGRGRSGSVVSKTVLMR